MTEKERREDLMKGLSFKGVLACFKERGLLKGENYTLTENYDSIVVFSKENRRRRVIVFPTDFRSDDDEYSVGVWESKEGYGIGEVYMESGITDLGDLVKYYKEARKIADERA